MRPHRHLSLVGLITPPSNLSSGEGSDSDKSRTLGLRACTELRSVPLQPLQPLQENLWSVLKRPIQETPDSRLQSITIVLRSLWRATELDKHKAKRPDDALLR
jgi:hypothetical protein